MPNFFVMTDSEALLLGYDFSPQMEDGETIVASNAHGTTLVAVYGPDGQEQASMIESGSLNIVGQMVQARIHGADADTTYTLSFFAATSTGNYLEGKVEARVSD